MSWIHREGVCMNYPRFCIGAHGRRLTRKHRDTGSALVEYTIVVLFFVSVLFAGEYTGTTQYLAEKVREAYASFVYALSISWI